MSRRPTINRNVPAAAVPQMPAMNRQVPTATRPKPRFNKHFFKGAEVQLCVTVPVNGLMLSAGEVYFGDLPASRQQYLYMNKITYEHVTSDHDGITAIQDAIAMGVNSKMVDVSTQSWGGSVPIVDRDDKPKPERDSLPNFAQQVENFFVELQGFDVSKMTDTDKAEYIARYQTYRDTAKKYRVLMAQVDSSFEVLQRKMMEIVSA